MMAQQVNSKKVIATSDNRYWLEGREDDSGIEYILKSKNSQYLGTIIILNSLPVTFHPIKLKKNEKYLLLIEVRKRKKGYGKLIMEAIAKRYEINTVYLISSPPDHPLWRKVGTIVKGNKAGCYKIKLSRWIG